MFDNQSTDLSFREYKSHRVVRAAKINVIYNKCCVGVEPNGHTVTFKTDGKPTPQVGWYVVAYDDGYLSFCPGEQFEKGYSPVVHKQAQAQAKKQEEKKETVPKVTLNGIKDKIAKVVYLNAGLLTICIATMSNGFHFVGKSACASPENFNQEIGVKLAFDDAVRQMWEFEGYLLHERLLHEQVAAEAYMMAALAEAEAAHGTVG